MGDVSWERVIAAGIVLAAALAIAVFLRLVTGRLTRQAGNTRSPWDDIGARLIKDLAMPVSVILGLWIAAKVLELPRGTLDITAKVLTAVTIFVITLSLARLIAAGVSSVALARQGVAGNVTIFANITRVIVIGVGIMVMLQSLGVSITPLLGALGVGGLAVALALQDTLANLFAGVHVLAAKTIEPGDYIKLSTGQEGYVVDINWRNTSIRTLSDNIEVIPNMRFSDTILTNYHRPTEDMSILVDAKVHYEADLDEVEDLCIEVGHEVMKEVQGGVADTGIFVRFKNFDDGAVGFHVILRSSEFGDQFLISHEYLKRLHRRIRERGIQPPYWQHRVSLGDGHRGNGVPVPRTEPPARKPELARDRGQGGDAEPAGEGEV
ncbi:mechanosensitive ion channel family protein [Actinomadura sp. KC345]|uniref:mechanosensitive ion channel family protein n=1 Tax=Actinomadura sp. KC345 TaxID=2530371 RepID=UPI00104CD411|nr:mechanosensitive ion channel family protein [Actinomadura sp. KC345]TDC45163.1 mechanosensitive ion channel family protein [Actinomadura sp. KC345]